MSEEPEVPQMSEPAGETPPGENPPENVSPVSTSAEVTTGRLGLAGGAPRQARSTGSLLRRITGSLKRSTGSLREPDQPETGYEARLELGDGAPDFYPAERRKSVTGQLGSIITGILRGSAAEGEPSPTETKRPKTEVDEYVSELRQNLVTEEISHPKPQGTGRLIRSITGSLKRVTDPLRRTGHLFRRRPTGQIDQPEIAPPPPAFEAEIEEDILAGRLNTTSIADPAAWVEPEDFVIELEPGETLTGPTELEFPAPDPLEMQAQEAPWLAAGEVDSISLLESGSIAALDRAEEQAREVDSGQEWMAEIRQETAEQETSDLSTGSERRRSTTGKLLAFITGILRRPEERKTGQVEAKDQIVDLEEVEEANVSDDLVTGRLDRSLGIPGEEEPQVDRLPGFPAEEFAPTDQDQGTFTDEDAILEDLVSRFGQVSGEEVDESGQPFAPYEETAQPDSTFEQPAQPYTSFSDNQGDPYASFQSDEPYIPFAPIESEDQSGPITLSPEDERLIWGETDDEPLEEGRTIRADDYWDGIELSRKQDQGPLIVSAEDAYAAAFLTGEDVLPELEIPRIETRLHRVTEHKGDKELSEPFEDIRSIVLEDLPPEEWPQLPGPAEEWLDQEEGVEGAAPAALMLEEAVDTPPAAPAVTWKNRLAALTLIQKIILIEAVAVVVALVIAVPYFLLLMQRGPVEMTPTNYLVPRQLPAGVPYPTGMTLPGGWYFSLEKSTFIEGQWKPDGGEWLEGTELRRVVALPWNPQTEAVVQTFQPGDVIDLYLNNNRSIRYKVTEIERVPVDEIKVYTDLRPSLAIILYREDTDQRWVVISQR